MGLPKGVCDNHCSRTNTVPLLARCLLRVILCQDRSRAPSFTLAASFARALGLKSASDLCLEA